VTTRLTVTGTEQLTPGLRRVWFHSEDLSAFAGSEHTDRYVKLIFLKDGVTYPEPLDVRALRGTLPPEDLPVVRTYTALFPDVARGTLAIDFVVHGDEGVAGPWAARARPGDVLHANGPGGAYAPDPDADWHLLVGDESALPAIGAALTRLPAGTPALVFVEVADPTEQQTDLVLGEGVSVVWVHRGDGVPGEALATAVKAVQLPAGTGHVFVHGEAGLVKDLRLHLRAERGLDPAFTSISGYWRRGDDEDGWQAGKRAWNAEVEAAEQGLAAG